MTVLIVPSRMRRWALPTLLNSHHVRLLHARAWSTSARCRARRSSRRICGGYGSAMRRLGRSCRSMHRARATRQRGGMRRLPEAMRCRRSPACRSRRRTGSRSKVSCAPRDSRSGATTRRSTRRPSSNGCARPARSCSARRSAAPARTSFGGRTIRTTRHGRRAAAAAVTPSPSRRA